VQPFGVESEPKGLARAQQMRLSHYIAERFGAELLGERRARFGSEEVGHIEYGVRLLYRRL
jgi:hypothetical protein